MFIKYTIIINLSLKLIVRIIFKMSLIQRNDFEILFLILFKCVLNYIPTSITVLL